MASISAAEIVSLPTYASQSALRLKSLYSDFSLQKQSNPTSYTSNVEWWRRTLEQFVLRGLQSKHSTQSSGTDRLVFHVSGSALADDFRVEGIGKPLSLPTVITELCESKQYYPLPEFLSSSKSIEDPEWLPYRIASYVIGKPLWWALQQLSIVSPDDTRGHASYNERWKKVKGDYVVLSLLDTAFHNVMKRQYSEKDSGSLADRLYSPESFRREFAAHALDDVVLSDLDVKVLLRYLQRDKQLVVVQGEVIKFVDVDRASRGEQITAVDAGVLALKTAVEKLQTQVDSIQNKISERHEQITTALRQKRKEVALSQLRMRKQLEDLLTKRLNSLDTLQSTLLRVEASAGDVEIMKSYESSTATLRAILAHPSLQREKIDETMDAMASANADAKEMDDVIRMGVDMAHADSGIDDAELEDELKALVEDVERESTAKTKAERVKEEEKEEQATHEKLSAASVRVPSGSPSAEKAEPERQEAELVTKP
ncbi:hypothetical protein WOLCODRAFT_96248 [Wolfiporia cocos MD-104 SS10]|uniref:Snf7-domain-containing protein n=1 Tax=Wolfiporia cocos (strain MD-104) TaxID=742152 RepID=A0A2H3J6V9_WOLCO|nr:hypothetical protein WOLCODRAFT_96248 [Wolfiporia cocos MD-104 SS10]